MGSSHSFLIKNNDRATLALGPAAKIDDRPTNNNDSGNYIRSLMAIYYKLPSYSLTWNLIF